MSSTYIDKKFFVNTFIIGTIYISVCVTVM